MMFVATLLICLYYFFQKDTRLFNLTGFALIISGAFGNLIDRLTMGKVVDFIDVGINQNLRWPIFNVADSFVTIGVIGLIIYLWEK